MRFALDFTFILCTLWNGFIPIWILMNNFMSIFEFDWIMVQTLVFFSITLNKIILNCCFIFRHFDWWSRQEDNFEKKKLHKNVVQMRESKVKHLIDTNDLIDNCVVMLQHCCSSARELLEEKMCSVLLPVWKWSG